MSIYMHLVVNLGWNLEDVMALQKSDEEAGRRWRKEKLDEFMKPYYEKAREAVYAPTGLDEFDF